MATQNNKYEQLKNYIAKSPYIEIIEWSSVCKSFDIPYSPRLFKEEYKKRFYNYLKHNTTTVSTVSKITGIPQKYLTQCKAYFEKKDKLRVIAVGKCPTTGTNHVQFVTTNPNIWKNPKLLENNKK